MAGDPIPEGWTEEPVVAEEPVPDGWTEEPVDVPTSAPVDASPAELNAGVRLVRSAGEKIDPSTLDFSRDPATLRYQRQRAEQEDLVRKAFRAGADPGLTPELADAKVATFFDIPLSTVRANRAGWLDTYAKASGDPRKWIDENPLSARLVLEHPERADQVVSDPEINPLMAGLNKAIDWFYDLRAESMKPENLNDAFSDSALGVKKPAASPEKAARIEAQRVDTAAQIASRAERDKPKPVTQVDNAQAQAIRERGSPLEIAAQRARESRAQLEVSKLWADRLWARRGGADTTLLDQQIQEAEEKAKGLYLGEKGWTQALAESWATSQSTLDVMGTSLERMGPAAYFGGLFAGAGVGLVTKNLPAATEAFTAGAALGAKFGGAAGAAEGSFKLELGDSYKQLLQARTDADQPLTEDEAIGGALIAASLKTGIELAELSAIMKALGPAGALVREGGFDAVKRALATNPGFRAMAVKAAQAWVGEGVEEVAQGATDDAISYLVRTKAQNNGALTTAIAAAATGRPELALNSLQSMSLPAGPVVDAEARKQDFVGGLMGGAVFGLGGLAVNASTHAVFGAKQERAAAQSPALAAIATNPKTAAMAKEIAGLVTAKTAEQGDEVSHMYIDANAFVTMYQTKEEAEAAITEKMGENGPRALAGAEFTGGKLQVPLETYIAKFGDVAQKLADDTAVRSDRLTPRELAEQQKENEAWAKAIADENRDVGASPTLDRFDALEQQLVDSGRMSAEEAKASLVPLRETFTTFAKKFGQKSEDLFSNVRILVDDGGKVLLLEARQAHASQRLSAELRDGKLDVTTAAERLFVDDHVSGLFTFDGWEAMQKEQPAQSVVAVTLPDIKPVNDDVQGGHDTANALLAHVAPAIAAVDPQAARKGTNFLIRGGPAELQRALDAVQALLPKGLTVEGAVGTDAKSALSALDTTVDTKRFEGALTRLSVELLQRAADGLQGDFTKLEREQLEKAGFVDKEGNRRPQAVERATAELAARKGLTPEQLDQRGRAAYPDRGQTRADLKQLPDMERQFAAAQAARIEQEKTGQRAPLRVQVTKGMQAAVAGMTQAEYFKRAYQDSRVPGVLSAVAWDNIPRKAFVASIDIKGLKDINALGKAVGDRVLDLFAETAARFDGSDFDFAHLSGDEYAAQHDDPAKLQAWLDAVRAELTKVGVPVKGINPKTGEPELLRISPAFRAGIGEKTYGAGDRALNRAKLEEKQRAADDLARGSSRDGQAGVEVRNGPGGDRGVRRGDGGSQTPAPAAYRRRGSALQGFIGAEEVGVGKAPELALEQDSNGFTNIAAEGTDKVYRIALKATANRSTFLHESAHVFLDLFNQLAARADAPESVRADWDITKKWLGIDALEGLSKEELTTAHEKWARAFEVYLAEGKYPTAKLAGAFQRFRLWMGTVYKRVTMLGEVSPDIRGVFDRLLAVDEEIEATQNAMGLKALPRELLGLSVADYQAHLDQLAEATSHARQQADFTIVREQLRATEGWWKEQHRAFREQAGEEYEGLTARKAQLLLRGKASGLVEFEPISLNREVVEGWLGPARAKDFLLAKDGVHPDEVVEAYGELGYATGRELVEGIAALPSKEDFVDARADQRMVEEHPGVLDERQKLRELVQKGMHGSATKEWALKEYAALAAQGPKTARREPTAAVLKRAAELLAAGRPAGELGTHAALVAERTAANKATKAAMRGDFAQAIVHKQKQILNMFLFDALREAQKEVDDFEALAGKLGKLKARQRLGKASPVYRDAVDVLLSTLGLGEPRSSIRDSLDALLGQTEQLMTENQDTVGFDKERILDRLSMLQPKTTPKGNPVAGWKQLALEDLRHVVRALNNIETAARNRTTVLLEQKRVAKEEAIAELQASAEASLPKLPDLPTEEARTLGQRIGGYWNSFDGGLLKIERMAEMLSGAKNTEDFIKSPWFQYIVAPIQAAKAKKVDLYRQHLVPLVQAFDAIPAETLRRQKELIDTKRLFPDHIDERKPVRRWEVLMMLLHSGNASNLQRLTEGRGITEEQLRAAAIDVGGTKEEYAWIQSIWDSAESLKPLSFDLEERDTGIRPEAIESRAFPTPHGEIRGGYFPAVYDRVTQVGQQQGEVTMAGLQDPTYTRPSTLRGHLKRRSEGFSDILSLSPASITRHFNQSIHDIAFREAIKSVGTLLLDKGIQRTLRERLGEGRAEQFKVWIQDVARGRGAEANDGLRFLANLAGAVRGNIVTAVLGYRFGNAAEDFTSNLVSALSATDLKAASLGAAIDTFARGPEEVRAMVLEKSAELRARQDQVQRELARQTARLAEDSAYDKLFNRGVIGFAKEHAFVMNEVSEWATSTPIWLGAYRQGLEQRLSEAEAVSYADAIIRQALVSHNLVDLPTMLRNRGVVGQMLMFAGAFNHFYNQFRTLHAQGRSAGAVGAAQVARYAGRAAGLSIGLFVVGAVVRGQGPAKDEPVEAWLFRKLALEGFAQLIPGLGEAANGIAAKRPHLNAKGELVLKEGFSPVRNNTLFGTGAAIEEAAVKALNSGDPKKIAAAGAAALGPIGGVPTLGPMQAADPIVRFITGTGDWRNPLDAASDALYGRKKDQPFNLVQGAADLLEGRRR